MLVCPLLIEAPGAPTGILNVSYRGRLWRPRRYPLRLT